MSYSATAAYSLCHAERHGLVIALHGLTGTSSQPLALLEGFGSTEFGILAPDLRAHGATSFVGDPADFTPQQLARDVEELVGELGLGSRRIRLVGISLGATVALELVRGSTLDIDAAVLVRPAHDDDVPANLAINLIIARLLRQDPSLALERLLHTDEYVRIATISPSAAAGLRAKITKPFSADLVMRLERGSIWHAFDSAETVSTPVRTLVIAAPQDPLHPVEVAKSWHRRIAGSAFALLPPRDTDGAVHAREARRLVQDFLASISLDRVTAP